MPCNNKENCKKRNSTSNRITKPTQESQQTWVKRVSCSFDYYANMTYLINGYPIEFNLKKDAYNCSECFEHVVTSKRKNGRHNKTIDNYRLEKCTLVFAVLSCFQSNPGFLQITKVKNTSSNPADLGKTRYEIYCEDISYKVIIQDETNTEHKYKFITGYPCKNER
jgi:hypothetical protein